MNKQLVAILMISVSLVGKAQTWYNSENKNVVELQNQYDSDNNRYVRGKEKESIKYSRAVVNDVDENGRLLSTSELFKNLNSIDAEKRKGDLLPNWRPFERNTLAKKPKAIRNKGLARLNRVYTSPTNKKEIFAATAYAGLWFSPDEGNSWSDLTSDKIPVSGVWSVAIHPENSGEIIIGDRFTMYRTENLGKTWTKIDSVTNLVRDIYFNKLNPEVVYSATEKGFYKSNDGGKSWGLKHKIKSNAMRIHPSDPNTIYISEIKKGDVFLHISTDGGESFTESVLPESNTRNAGRTRLEVSKAKPDNVYLITNNNKSYGFGALYVSENKGMTFNIVSNQKIDGGEYTKKNPNLLGYSKDGVGKGGQLSFCFAFGVSQTNPDEMYIAGVAMWKSVDGGKTWRNHAEWYTTEENYNRYVHADIHDIIAWDNKVWVVHDGGLSFSEDKSKTFVDRTAGINALEVLGLSINHHNSDIMGVAAMHIGSMIQAYPKYDGWLAMGGGDDNYCAGGYADEDHFFHGAGYVFNRAKLPSDNSKLPKTITTMKRKEPSGELGFHTRNQKVLFQSLTNYNGGKEQDGSSLYMSRDYGETWQEVFNTGHHSNDGRGVNARPYASKSKIEVAWNNPEIVYYKNGSHIYRSNDGGYSWRIMSNFNTTSDEKLKKSRIYKSRILDMVVDPEDDNTLYITFRPFKGDKVVMKSTDGGNSWSDFSHGIPKEAGRVNSIVIQRGSGDMYVGTYRGVYYRNKSMSEWKAFHNGLPVCDVVKVIIDYQKNRLIAGTFGRGIWLSNLQSKSDIDVRITSDKTEVKVGDKVDFSHYSVVPDDIKSVKWEFKGADIKTSSEKYPTVVYKKRGKHTVKLTITDVNGNSVTEKLKGYISVSW